MKLIDKPKELIHNLQLIKLKVFLAIIIVIFCIIFIKITIDPLFNIFSFSWRLDKELIVPYSIIIGGLFGPLLTLLSFILVYSSFIEQNKQTFMNKINNDIKYLREYIFKIRYKNSDSVNCDIESEEMGEKFLL